MPPKLFRLLGKRRSPRRSPPRLSLGLNPYRRRSPPRYRSFRLSPPSRFASINRAKRRGILQAKRILAAQRRRIAAARAFKRRLSNRIVRRSVSRLRYRR